MTAKQPLRLATLVEGPCVECRAVTEAVMLYGGEAEFLCVACQEKIRKKVAAAAAKEGG